MTQEKKKNGQVRLQKAIADAGFASRRKAEELIEAGRVMVNGHPAVIGQKVDPHRDLITVDGQKLLTNVKKRFYYIALNKPRGYVTTLSDEQGRKCVADLVKDIPQRVYPIGRLDRNSEGLLLLTNDGDFANRVMHPRFHIPKAYRVTVRPDVTDRQALQLTEGVMLDGVPTAPAQVEVLAKEPGRVVMQIVITEGRNRQIRRMCEAVGLEVARLKRVSEGPVRLGMLPPGQWRELTDTELSLMNSALRSGEQQAKDAVPGTPKPKAAAKGPRPAQPFARENRRTGPGRPVEERRPSGSWGSGGSRVEKKPASQRVYKKK